MFFCNISLLIKDRKSINSINMNDTHTSYIYNKNINKKYMETRNGRKDREEMCPLGLFIQDHNNNVLQLVTGN